MKRETDLAAGFFGKVTSHGDFVSRRLPQRFVQTWDSWLQPALQISRSQLGTAWLSTYLSSPIWRFALAPGVCDANAWAGLLMPSVDRVGRYFPLTIAAGVESNVLLRDWLSGADAWYTRLEALALSSLQADFDLQVFDEVLSTIRAPLARSVAAPRPGVLSCDKVQLMPGREPSDAAIAVGVPETAAQSLWWTDGSERVAPCVLQCRALPVVEGFTAMLDGQWRTYGWQL